MIAWQDSYSTGVEELDKQHKRLFQYTNDLGKMIEDNAVSKNVLEAALLFLGKYAQVHFGREEICMFKHQCPVAASNKQTHEQFLQKFKAIETIVKADGGNESTVIELHRFLENWLIDHICTIDVQLKPCVEHK